MAWWTHDEACGRISNTFITLPPAATVPWLFLQSVWWIWCPTFRHCRLLTGFECPMTACFISQLHFIPAESFLFMAKIFSELEKNLMWSHSHSCPSPGVISHSWHRAGGTLKLIGQAWRGYDCYDWRSPGEIEFLLVVMKRPEGEHGWDKVSIKLKDRRG